MVNILASVLVKDIYIALVGWKKEDIGFPYKLLLLFGMVTS